MLLHLREYLRPTSLAEAAALLRRAESRTALLAGGTELTGRMDDQTQAVVDLATLGLNQIETGPASITLGAMVTLKQLAAHPAITGLASGMLARAAIQAAPATIRAAATIGGTLAGEKGGDEIPTVLLALGARVSLVSSESVEVPLERFLAERAQLLDGAIIVSVTIPTTAARGSFHFVSRSPADRALLCAAAAGDRYAMRVAIGGYLSAPRLLGDDLTLPDGEPITDFRASAEYRTWVAPVLARRAALDAAGGESV